MSQIDTEAVRRICREFTEMPGLRLTPEQARRLWALDDSACAIVLDALVSEHFLERDPDGRYVRQDACLLQN